MESVRDTGSVKSELAQRTLDPVADTMPSSGVSINADETRQQKWQPEETTAYLLKWTDAEIKHRRINSATQLRTHIQEDGGSECHLFVLHGLPLDFFQALQDTLNIGADFIEAHVGRRSHRLLRKKTKTSYAHYDYPELVKKTHVPVVFHGSSQIEPPSSDLVSSPPSHTISTDGDEVILCRASIWLSEKAHVLCLDRPSWASPTSGLSRGRYKAYTSQGIPDEDGVSIVTMNIDGDGNTTTLGGEIPSLEKLLYENLRDGCNGSWEMLDFFEDLVLRQWGEFFENLGPDLPANSTGITALFWQTQICLERNLDAARQRAKTKKLKPELSSNPKSSLYVDSLSTTPEWEELLSRASRRAQLQGHLLSHLRPLVTNVQTPVQPSAGAGVGISSARGRDDLYTTTNYNYNPNPNASSSSDEGQRSLNRVTYLGGVLLPFSIISGILAIDEPYGPGGSSFWIFWAVTVPLTLITLAVIYADSIRKVEVSFVPLNCAPSPEPDSSTTHPHTGPGPGRVSTPQLEQAIPFSVPISNRLAEPATMPTAADDWGGEDEDEDEDDAEVEPDTIVEKRWENKSAAATGEATARKWRKEQLGWMGACATLFQLYKLKKGVPPGHSHRNRRGPGPGPGPRHARTG
ncbi:hypothetical protein F5Y19DRAFT_461668 [Xylariaceae sp. FL1651]|nr:hypothetical protein F5Y19DRAFT_461668 [Xylariaceae sp. FL1651]